MSTSAQLDDGGGGTTDDDGQLGPDRGVTITSDDGSATLTLPSWIFALRPLVALVNQPRAFIVAAIVGIPIGEAAARLATGQSAAEIIVEDYIFQQLLLPLGAALFQAGVNLLFGIASLLFGPDLAVGRPVGLVDFPFAFSGPIAFAVQGVALELVGAVQAVNLTIASTLAPLGLAAPTFVTFIWVVEAGVFAWGAWILFSSVDIPVVNVKGYVLAVSRPVRNLLGVFR